MNSVTGVILAQYVHIQHRVFIEIKLVTTFNEVWCLIDFSFPGFEKRIVEGDSWSLS